MNEMIKILEIVGDEYILDTDNLVSTLKKGNGCNNIVIISIMGPKGHGKTFLLECLINYMNSQHKDEWPECDDAIIQKDSNLHRKNSKKNKILKISSQPFLIEEKIENQINKTAVFVMDSEYIFDRKMLSKKVRDITALFLLTSSNVIFNHKNELPVIYIFVVFYLKLNY
jgi:ABC-type phosphate transport system ATPase subunit